MRTLALSAVGVDRPGIIAAVAARLVAHDVNVTDSQMGILRGHFAMTLILTARDDLDFPALERDLQRVSDELDLEALTLRSVEEAHPAAPDEPTHAITVYGADHTGILAAVMRALADTGINVCDVKTRLSENLYVMFVEVAAPDGVPEERLQATAAEQGVEISVRPVEADAL